MASRDEFLRILWSETINGVESGHWIDNCIRAFDDDPTSPFADVGRAMKNMRANGVADADIVAIGRGASYEAVFDVLYKLGDPGVEDGEMLFEELLMADPTGREGSPPPKDDSD
jgi:hypothetical protein